MVDLASISYLPETSTWGQVPRLEDGMEPTGGPVDPETDTGLMNWQAQILAARTRYLRDRLDRLAQTTALEITVGPGGTFATINAALAELSSYRQIYVRGGRESVVRLLPGFVMAEQVIVAGVNLGWVRIRGTDAQTTITRSALTTPVLTEHYPAFVAADGGILPIIDQLFEMDSSGAALNRHGIMLLGAGTGVRVGAGKGIKRAGGDGLHVRSGGTAGVPGAVFSQAGRRGIYANGAVIQAQDVVVTGAGAEGILAEAASLVNAQAAQAGGCASGGCLSAGASNLNAAAGNFRSGSANAPTDIRVLTGGIISAVGATGGLSTPVNTPSGFGLILA